MTCACGGITRVFDSRETNGAVRRRRTCTVCRQRFTTYELSVPRDETAIIIKRNRHGDLVTKRVAHIDPLPLWAECAE